MANFQIRILLLDLCFIIILLTYADCSRSIQVQKIKQHINKTVFVGETVTLQCNRTLGDAEISWKMNNSLIFIHSPYLNRSMRNFTSDRMYIDPAVSRELKIYNIEMSDAGNYSCYPAAIRWILTITDQTDQTRQDSNKQIPLYIISSCIGFIIVYLIIRLSICTHRKQRQKVNSDFSEADKKAVEISMNSYFDRQTVTECVYSLHKLNEEHDFCCTRYSVSE
ncbi:uncharacterized protein LOC127447065 [Myxocyprinus asiaticus]|uniref:uncharacterized protein LOC127447065 n=1 Tax=Myxocyprinus asiaticus TaxID=70543 RepID=UPI0022233968|nr:uncharacterized protein LOC127447065 [Myxocyprinus asiaticus]